MSNEKITKLIEMVESVKSLKAVKCGVAHEQVLIDMETSLPISQYIGETAYERIGFCPDEIRSQRISCSHSNAPFILKDALNLLTSEGKDVENLMNEYFDVTGQICQLDHKKGDAEKHLAILIEKKINSPEKSFEKEISLAKKEINKLENEHSNYVDKIAEVRNQIVAELEMRIKENKIENF